MVLRGPFQLGILRGSVTARAPFGANRAGVPPERLVQKQERFGSKHPLVYTFSKLFFLSRPISSPASTGLTLLTCCANKNKCYFVLFHC